MTESQSQQLERVAHYRGATRLLSTFLVATALAVTVVAAPGVARAQAASESADLPSVVVSREPYEEWVRTWVDSWQSREVEIVLGEEWRAAAAGQDLLGALSRTDLPVASWQLHPRFPRRICPRTRATSECGTVSYMTHERPGDLIDLPPDEIEAVIWVGPTVPSDSSTPRMAWDAQLTVERVILFARGYLADQSRALSIRIIGAVSPSLAAHEVWPSAYRDLVVPSQRAESRRYWREGLVGGGILGGIGGVIVGVAHCWAASLAPSDCSVGRVGLVGAAGGLMVGGTVGWMIRAGS